MGWRLMPRRFSLPGMQPSGPWTWPQVGATSRRGQGIGLSPSRQLAPHPAPRASDESQGYSVDKGGLCPGGTAVAGPRGPGGLLADHSRNAEVPGGGRLPRQPVPRGRVNSSRDPRTQCGHPGGLPEPEPVTATLVKADEAGRLWRVVVKGLEGSRNGHLEWTRCQAREVWGKAWRAEGVRRRSGFCMTTTFRVVVLRREGRADGRQDRLSRARPADGPGEAGPKRARPGGGPFPPGPGLCSRHDEQPGWRLATG